jgi:inorganic triphosphatase YgiF
MTVVQAKFRVGDPETFFRLQIIDRLAGYRLSTSRFEQVDDTYMDTRGRRLLAAGYWFRKREQVDGVMMTLATIGQTAGAIHRWDEWEILLAAVRPPEKWPESPVRTRVLQLAGTEPLLRLVDLQQTRVIRGLYRGAQQVAEVRLDSVGYKGGAHHQVHFELEVELIPPAREETLILIANQLEAEQNLWNEPASKFDLAYAEERDRVQSLA